MNNKRRSEPPPRPSAAEVVPQPDGSQLLVNKSLQEGLRQEMAKSGGKLPSLDATSQKWERTGNKNVEGEHNNPAKGEGEVTMHTETVQTPGGTTIKTADVPPAGGATDAQVGRAVIEMMRKAGAALEESARPKKWSEKMLDASVPAIKTIVTVAGCAAAIAIVNRTLGTKHDGKEVAGNLSMVDNASKM